MKAHKLRSLPHRFQPLTTRQYSPSPTLHTRQMTIVSTLSVHNKALRRRINTVIQRSRSEASSPAHSPMSRSPTPTAPTPLPFLVSPTPSPVLFPTKEPVNRKERTRKALGALRHLVQLRIPGTWIVYLKQLVPQTPCSTPQSARFLMACRMGDTETVDRMLACRRWLALEYDRVRRTGLHWAARRSHIDIMQTLLRYGAFVDARDTIGRTPVFVAAKAGKVAAVGLLLSCKASPFLRTFGGESPVSVSQNLLVRKMLIRTMQVTILLKFAEASKRRVFWEQEVKALLRSELRRW